MSVIENIKAQVLNGATLRDIVMDYPNYTQSTLKTYVARINAGLTEDERKYRDRSRNKRPPRPAKYHRKYQERSVVGPVQVRIGLKLLQARMDLRLKSEEFCEQHDFANRARLSLMEQGYHDFTVSEVQKIADLLDMTVEELLLQAHDKDIAA